MGWRQAKGCEVKQICGRLCRNHKGTRRPPPPILMQHDSSKSISSGEVSTELQSSKKWQKLLLRKELGCLPISWVFCPTSERYTASSSSGSSQRRMELMKPKLTEAHGETKEVCLDISIFLGVGEHLISFCFASWLLFGECTRRK